MRIDSHVHVWNIGRGDYGWLAPTPSLLPIFRDFALADLRASLAAARIDAVVLVQAAPTVAETRFLLDVADASEALVRGVVGWADLAAEDVAPILEELAANPLLKSLRPMLQDLEDPSWIAQPRVGHALRHLVALRLRLDALVTPRELPCLTETLRHHPDLAVVLDHCAKPDIAHAGWQPWADDVAALAADTPAFCKLSGLVTEAGAAWRIDDLRRYVDHVIECFGPSRVMWGSDWPVLTLAASYGDWMAASEALLGELAPSEREAIFGGNAARFYGLGA
jgi:L-fuconolactonase